MQLFISALKYLGKMVFIMRSLLSWEIFWEPSNSCANRAEPLIRASFTSAFICPKESRRAGNAFLPLTPNETLRAALTLGGEVVLEILKEVFILTAAFTDAVFKNCACLARDASSGKKLLKVFAFRFRDRHECLRLLVVAKSTADHYWVLSSWQEMKCEALSPREHVMFVVSFIFLLRKMSILFL